MISGDTDPDDLSDVSVMGLGAIACETYNKNVAFEDLKNNGWSDWDYNDLIVKLEAELCFKPIPGQSTQTGNWGNFSNSPQEILSCSNVDIEAETGNLIGFSIVNDASASGGSYVHTPDLGIGDYTEISASRMVTYSVNIPTSGIYSIYGLTQGLSGTSDSFWFQLNDETPVRWNIDRSAAFEKDYVTNFENNNEVMSFNLPAGEHVVTIYNREDGSRLDALTFECLEILDTPSMAISNSTITYTLLARGASYDHALNHNLPFANGGQYTLETFDAQGQSLSSVNGWFDPNQPIEIFASSKVGLPPYTAGDPFNTQTNSLANQTEMIKGHSAVMSFVVNNPENYLLGEISPFPWDLFLPVHDTGQDVHLMIPGHMNNSQLVNSEFDADSPLIGYNLPFGFTFDEEWTWPVEFQGIWNAYPEFVNFMDSGFSQNTDWFTAENSNGSYLWSNRNSRMLFENGLEADVESRYTASPAVADLDNDGDFEIVIGDLIKGQVTLFDISQNEIWTNGTEGGVRATAVVEDIDFDGDLEVIVGDEAGYLHAWHHDGQIVSSFPISVTTSRLLASPTIGDINNDGEVEIIQVGSDSQVYALDTSGNLLWSADLSFLQDKYGAQTSNGAPALEDIDVDGDIEIIVPTQSGAVMVFDHDGNLVWTYATDDAISSTPVVANFDPDNPGVEILFGSGDTYLYVLDRNGELLWRRSTGWIIRGSPMLLDSDGD
ncbi:MAG: DUF4842 domain-containing protein, partial [Chloroflexota bacterium]